MSTCAIRAEQVSKKFYLGQDIDYSRLSEVLQNTALGWLKKLRSRTQTEVHLQNLEQQNTFWALRNINFEVQQGEVLGIIGRNGAGKSTLLKILSRVTRPTSGRIGTRGRIGSLLEVGTGFHPELTGRENIFLNGSILGMTRREIEAKFDEIVAFAEIDQFLDTPVKRYSSGMYTRLAFSVAAHLETEILIVDEVLAVGDAMFQKKCLGKMSDVAHQGRTVLFVSHNMAAVKSLCTHGLYLDRGTCVCQGLLAPVLEEYYNKTTENQTPHRQWELADAPGNSSVRLLMATVTPVTCDVLSIDSGIRFTFRFLVTQPAIQLSLILRVETQEALVVFQQKTLLCTPEQPCPQGYQTTAELQPNILNQGHYRVTLILVEEDTHTALTIDNAVEFSVANQLSGSSPEQQPGLLAPNLQFETLMVPAQ